ncbi:MAG: TRL domain-containing protein [Planctomycetota bacterium]
MALLCMISLMALATAPGCVNGRIYTHVTEPLLTNFDRTPMVAEGAEGDVIKIEYNSLQVQWNNNAIGDIAKKAGFQEVYYADKETISILGIWTSTYVHVYGARNVATSDGS